MGEDMVVRMPIIEWGRGQYLRYNAAMMHEYQNTIAARRGLACHELGHTLGLRHTSGSTCMAVMIDTNGKYYTVSWLAQHDKNHINAQY